MSMQSAIEKRISEYLATDDTRHEWVKPAVRRHSFLPLYLGWIAVLGLRPDGSFVRWDHEEDRESVKTLADAYWQRMAICQGTKKYPELNALIPPRPALAKTCVACGGSGLVDGAPLVICQCGGIGWTIPGEQRGPSPG